MSLTADPIADEADFNRYRVMLSYGTFTSYHGASMHVIRKIYTDPDIVVRYLQDPMIHGMVISILSRRWKMSTLERDTILYIVLQANIFELFVDKTTNSSYKEDILPNLRTLRDDLTKLKAYPQRDYVDRLIRDLSIKNTNTYASLVQRFICRVLTPSMDK